MKRYVALLIAALLALIVVQSVKLSRARSENQLLHDSQQQAEQSRSELELKLEDAKRQQAEVESLRMEVAGLRGEAQGVRQALERARSQQSPSAPRGPAQPAPTLTDRNRVLLDYIGEPVDPALNTDARYTKESVLNAVQFAARNAGVNLQRLEGDESEYPCLVGVFCAPQDYPKLLDEIKKLDGYEYSGGVGGSDSFHTLNITPTRAYPSGAKEQIDRRVTLRQQMFYKSLSATK